jgi:UPF0755 protein
MAYGAVIDALVKGPPPPKTTPITITEGRTRMEINGLLKDTSLQGSYAAATVRSPVLNPRAYGAPRTTKNLEGFLFPATYEVRQGGSVDELVRKQLQTFKQRFGEINMRKAQEANLTPYEVVIIASLVEREAALPKERRIIAGVIYNRLRTGEVLAIDATTRYQLNNWTKSLTDADFERTADSPYNTRRNAGLPPTPIGNPGQASMQAAANPAKHNYLYYVVKPGKCGEHAFASTLEEHNRNAARYSEARAARGYRDPQNC